MIADDHTRPTECLFGICLPLTKEEFQQRLSPAYPANFVQMRKQQLSFNDEALWDLDYGPTVRLFQHELGLLKELGVHCRGKFSLKDLSSLSQYSVATILAHHEEPAGLIELYDGRHDLNAFIAAMPPDYNGIFDLTMCRSAGLQMMIKRKFPQALVVANKLNTNPEFRLICYRKAISLLLESDISYIDAIAKVRLMLIKSPKNK
jgi:hypothetical protein